MKRIVVFVLAMLLCAMALTACGGKKSDPMKLANFYDDANCAVAVEIDDEEIEEFADEWEIKSGSIDCVVTVVPDDGEEYDHLGIFIFCNSTGDAKQMVEHLEKAVEDDESLAEFIVRHTIDRSGKVVFFGCEDTWDEVY